MRLKGRVFILIFFFILQSCNSPNAEKPSPSFYFWKSNFALSTLEKNTLTELKTSKLYIKYFDVAWNDATKTVKPEAKITFSDEFYKKITIVPVVFITNKTLLHTNVANVPILSKQIADLIKQMNEYYNFSVQEIQLDCDWTELTQNSYFKLLELLKIEFPNQLISCTIRLHQVKYYEQTGIPPVKKGILMFYNMGKLGERTQNSIYNYADAEKYVHSARNCPLELDVALPIFSWAIHYQNDKIKELIPKPDLVEFNDTTYFEKSKNLSFKVKKSLYFRGYYLQQNDELKIEKITSELCKIAAKQVAKNLKKTPKNIIFYDLDSDNLLEFNHEKINQIICNFN